MLFIVPDLLLKFIALVSSSLLDASLLLGCVGVVGTRRSDGQILD